MIDQEFSLPAPARRYLGFAASGASAPGVAAHSLKGDARLIRHLGRVGLLADSVHTRVILPGHTLNRPRGTATLWMLPLADLNSQPPLPHLLAHEPLFQNYTLYSDCENLRDWTQATLALTYSTSWYPQFFAKFCRGTWEEIFGPMQTGQRDDLVHPEDKPRLSREFRAFAYVGHVDFRQGCWYQVAVAWDKAKNDYRLYLNGVRVGTTTQFAPLVAHDGGDTLYAGNTAIALSDVRFYESPTDDAGAAAAYRAEETLPENPVTVELARDFAGQGVPAWSFDGAGSDWKLAQELSLRDPAHLNEFYLQGFAAAASIGPEGLSIKTRPTRTLGPAGWDSTPPREMFDEDQLYLWSRRRFEGDFAIEYDFMPMEENGLSLLMIQATGMQGEDFMADYPLRKSGAMRMVCWENVRNYHWEYFREMDDCRHDVGSHLLVKNPWMRPLAFRCLPARVAVNRWHRLQFVREGARLRGSLDGRLVFDVQDDGFSNHGPVNTSGRYAIRCMFKTHLLVRNLRVWCRPPFYESFGKASGTG